MLTADKDPSITMNALTTVKQQSKFRSLIDSIDDRQARYIKIIISLIVSLWVFIWIIQGVHDQFIQFNITSIIITSLYYAALYLGISIGLNMTYKLIGFANFAHAEYFVIGAYAGVWFSIFNTERGNEPSFADYYLVLLMAFLISGTVAVLGDYLIFQPLRDRGSATESLMITSIGWGIILRSIISIFFTGEAEYFRIPVKDELTFNLGSSGFKISNPINLSSISFGIIDGNGYLFTKSSQYNVRYQTLLVIIIIAILVILLFLFLAKTKLGKALRATSDNIDLAESSGIDTLKMIRITWFIGGGLAGIAGALFASIAPVIPYSGFLFLLPAFAVIVLGGVGSLKGSVFAALIIGFSQEFSRPILVGISKMSETRSDTPRDFSPYSAVIPFVVLIIVILIKPLGLYGED